MSVGIRMFEMSRHLAIRKLFLRVSKAATKYKDPITISFGAVALVVSLLTAYFTYFRTVDDIRVFVGVDSPKYDFPNGEELVRIRHEHVLTFANAGTRAVGIVQLELAVQEVNGSDICDLSSRRINYDIEPFVVPAAQVVVKSVRLGGKQSGSSVTPREGDIFLPFPNRERERTWRSCLMFGVVTPDDSQFDISLKLSRDSLPGGGGSVRDSTEPFVIYRR
jgi:hypothetical protein